MADNTQIEGDDPANKVDFAGDDTLKASEFPQTWYWSRDPGFDHKYPVVPVTVLMETKDSLQILVPRGEIGHMLGRREIVEKSSYYRDRGYFRDRKDAVAHALGQLAHRIKWWEESIAASQVLVDKLKVEQAELGRKSNG